MAILASLSHVERNKFHQTIRTTRDKHHARRLMAILMMHEGKSVTDVQRLTGAARSSIGRWLAWYRHGGLDALASEPVGRPQLLPARHILGLLFRLLECSPQDLGYQRSRWSTELLAMEVKRHLHISIAASTIRKWLPKAGIVWRRPVPTLRIKDHEFAEKMSKIDAALARCDKDHPVFYEDEVDIALNPKLGADWMPRGQQKKVVTPGQNTKHYLAGVLHAKTGKVLYVSGMQKTSELFIRMLERLRNHYRGAKTITLILDNYIIHKSRKVQAWLLKNPKFELLFQPVYSPWINKIELLWHKLHDTITRNHQCRNMWSLMQKVRTFLDTASPFPGNGYGTAML